MNQIIITYALLIIEEWVAIGLYMHCVRPRLILQSRWVSIKTVAGFPFGTLVASVKHSMAGTASMLSVVYASEK